MLQVLGKNILYYLRLCGIDRQAVRAIQIVPQHAVAGTLALGCSFGCGNTDSLGGNLKLHLGKYAQEARHGPSNGRASIKTLCEAYQPRTVPIQLLRKLADKSTPSQQKKQEGQVVLEGYVLITNILKTKTGNYFYRFC